MEGEKLLKFIIDKEKSSIIKVIGVGGGGGNAANHMYRQGIHDVTFIVCNTDNQALLDSPIETKIQLGQTTTAGLGAGGKPERARMAAEESLPEIQQVLENNTKMVFITAGMGGGTGTGAAPVIAKASKDLGILTVGIVTIPFAFERERKIKQALAGIAEMRKNVDALLVINNEKLREIYPDFELPNAFAKADDVLASAAKGIAEIITISGYINVDFADVNTIMKDGGVAVMNSGYANGEKRISKAISNALESPLINDYNIHEAKKILLSIYSSKTNQVRMEEMKEINEFMDKMGEEIEVIWEATYDDTLGDDVKITIIATGFSDSKLLSIQKEVENEITDSLIDDETEELKTSETNEIDKKIEKTITEEAITKDDIRKFYGDTEQMRVPDIQELDDETIVEQLTEMSAYKRRQMNQNKGFKPSDLSNLEK